MTHQNHPFYDDHNKGRNEWYIWVGGFFLIYLASFAIPYYIFAYHFENWRLTSWAFAVSDLFGDPAYFYRLLTEIILTVPFIVAIWFVQTKIRQRPLSKLLNSCATGFRWKRFLAGILTFFGILLLAYSAFFAFTHALKPPHVLEDLGWQNASPQIFVDSVWPIFKMTLLLLPLYSINVLAQELAFRGFLDQGLVRFVKPTAAAFLLSAIIFALWHLRPSDFQIYFQYGEEKLLGLYLLNLIIFGLLMSLLCEREGGLEAAIGLHLTNNVVFSLVESPHTAFLDLSHHSRLSHEFYNLMDTAVFYGLALLVLSYWKFGLSKQDIAHE